MIKVKFGRIIISGLLAFMMAASSAVAVSAETVSHETELSALAGEPNARDREGLPVVDKAAVLAQKEWNGKTKLRANTCYFIGSGASVTVNTSKTLPESSMIVVENGGKLTVNKGAKLYAKGAVIVHSNAKLTVSGQAFIKSTGACVVNGDLYVGASGRLTVYSNLQVSAGGMLSARGRVSVGGKGKILGFGNVNKLKGGYVAQYTRFDAEEKPLYIAEEYSAYADKDIVITGVFDDSMEITDPAEKLKFLRSFESILYKYDGAFNGIDVFTLNPRANMTIFMCKCHFDCECCQKPAICCPLYNWNGRIVDRAEDGNPELEKGTFYCAVLGSADAGLFAPVDPSADVPLRAV